MTDEQALLATILAHPADDLPRLVFADWLDEHGFHERAEFIRVQCALAEDGLCILVGRKMMDGVTPTDCGGTCDQCRLRERERELWKSAKHAWFPQIEGENHLLRHTEECSGRIFGGSIVDAVECSFRRGFVEAVRLPLAAFLGGECGECRGLAGNWNEESGEFAATCVACKGTGRTEGIAKRLFESQPVTSCVLSDRHPTAFQGRSGATLSRWAWNCDDRDRQLDSWIPFELAQCLEGFERDEESTWFYYSTAEAAYAALIAAAVRLGRSLASLPPLRATPPAEAEATETRPADLLADVLHPVSPHAR